MRVQTVTITITYNETEFDEPSSWDWDNIIEGVDVGLSSFGPVYKAENNA